jgi:glutamate racemase
VRPSAPIGVFDSGVGEISVLRDCCLGKTLVYVADSAHCPIKPSGVVDVLATGATLGGERFAGLAQRVSDGVELLTQARPRLVEAGELDGTNTVDLLRLYVRPLLAHGADTLVLGYPFVRRALTELVGLEVVLIDTGEDRSW